MSSQEDAGETRQTKSFFCHSCSNNFRKTQDQVRFVKNFRLFCYFPIAACFQEFVCPNCLDGFIEELPENSNNISQQDEQEDFTMRGVFGDLGGPFQMTSGNNTPYFRIANEILGPIITGSLGGVASTSG